MENRAFKIAGIKTLIKRNYRQDPNKYDLEARVDDTLSMRENWNNNFKDRVTAVWENPLKSMYYKVRYEDLIDQ